MEINLVRILVAIVTLYLIICGTVYILQESLLFFPGAAPFDECKLEGVERVRQKFDGHEVRYLLKPKPEARSWVIVFHGNAGTACDRDYFAELMKDLPVNFIFAEYPGYAGDSTAPSQASILPNAVALYDHVLSNTPGAWPVILLGESLGSGVATYVASQRPSNGLILISPYTSIADVAASRFWFLPTRLLIKNPFPANKWATAVKTPVLIIHGVKDDLISIDFGREQAKYFSRGTNVVELPNSGHNDWIVNDGETAKTAINQYVQMVLQHSSY